MAKFYDTRIAELAGRQLGLVTRSQLLQMGLSSPAVAHRLAARRLLSVHPGVYALPATAPTQEQQLLAALLAAGGDSAASHLSAGMFWKLDGIAADRPHIVVPHGRKLRLVGAVVHRTRTLKPGNIVRRGLFRVTSPTRTLIDLAGVLNFDQLEDVLDDALRRRLVNLRGLIGNLGASGRRGMEGCGGLRRLLDARLGTREPGSPLETRFRRRLVHAGLPMPVPQYEVRDESGRLIARVDFAYPDARLALEVDGYAYHSGRKRWEADLARQNRLIAAGWRVLRFSSQDVDDPASLPAIERLLCSGESNIHISR